MEKLPHIRGRIVSYSELHELIRALEALAATHYREAQETLPTARGYFEIAEQAYLDFAPETAPDIGEPGVSAPCALIALCSEHGFVGAFNDRVLDLAEEERAPDEELVIVGRRGAQVATERGFQPDQSFPMAAHVGATPHLARQICISVAWAARIRVVLATHRAGGASEIVCRTLPIAGTEPLHRAPSTAMPLHQLPMERLRRRLHGELVFASIARFLVESLASENATRLSNMQASDRNIQDKLAELRQKERVLRQEAITEELLDIMTGAEAVLAGHHGATR